MGVYQDIEINSAYVHLYVLVWSMLEFAAAAAADTLPSHTNMITLKEK